MEQRQGLTWRKSTHSSANGGACIETASTPGAVLIRDTTNRSGATLTVPPAAWRTFTTSISHTR